MKKTIEKWKRISFFSRIMRLMQRERELRAGWELRLMELDRKAKIKAEEKKMKTMRKLLGDKLIEYFGSHNFLSEQERGWMIRLEYDFGKTQIELAEKYRVSRRTIGRILKEYDDLYGPKNPWAGYAALCRDIEI